MRQKNRLIVKGQDGLQGSLSAAEQSSNSPKVTLRLDDGREVLVDRSILVQQLDGSYTLPLSLADLEAAYKAPIETADLRAQQRREEVVIPLVAEDFEVHKEEVTTGIVRVRKVVHEHEEVIDEPLLREYVDVKRIPVNKLVESAPVVYDEGDLMIIPVLEEVIVVEKRLRLKEEIHITRHRETIHEPQKLIVREENVYIDHLEPRNTSDEGHASSTSKHG